MVAVLIPKQRLPHLLLYGPPGTGKTSTVLALARHIYGNKNMRQMVLELNASDDRGIDVVRFVSNPFPPTSHTNSLAENKSKLSAAQNKSSPPCLSLPTPRLHWRHSNSSSSTKLTP
jgi:replication factor C subunit 3/5